MITPSQSKALILLAEALEACMKVGVTMVVHGRNEIEIEYSPIDSFSVDLTQYADAVSPIHLRFMLSQLIPKQES
jgi:hypothetical protein